MFLIVGLGNPGKEYENTRHNVGFMVLDKFAHINNLDFNRNKFNGLYAEGLINNQKTILLKPQSYMNLSGEVVKKFVDFYKIPIENILIIHDDLDIELGKYKLKTNSSSGGHNGLKNIELHLSTKDYKRLKIGISNNKNYDTKDYVLGKFSIEEKELLNKVIDISQNIINDLYQHDFNQVMNKYNHK